MVKLLYVCIFLIISLNAEGNIWLKSVDTIQNVEFIPVKGFETDPNASKTMVYQDSVNMGHPVLIRSSGTKVRLNYPTFFWMSNQQKTLYLIYPGEKINTYLDSNECFTLSVNGNETRTNELAFFKLLGQQTGPIYVFNPIKRFPNKLNSKANYDKKENQIYRLKKRRLRILDSFSNASNVSNKFKRIAINTIKCAAFKDTLSLMCVNKDLLGKQDLYSKLLNKRLKSFKLITYSPFLLYYNAAKSIVSLNTSKYISQPIKNETILKKNFEFVNSKFNSGITKDFLMANIISNGIRHNLDIVPPIRDKFLNEVTDATYKNIILSQIKSKIESEKVVGKGNYLYNESGAIVEVDSLLSKHKGKLLYIDFWASWCMPCREEMPYSAKLRKKYTGKPVVFLYISMDENKQNWLNASKEENMNEDNNFLLLNSKHSEFVKKYEIITIPRYMLIDKNGKIISADALRPSDPKLNELILNNI